MQHVCIRFKTIWLLMNFQISEWGLEVVKSWVVRSNNSSMNFLSLYQYLQRKKERKTRDAKRRVGEFNLSDKAIFIQNSPPHHKNNCLFHATSSRTKETHHLLACSSRCSRQLAYKRPSILLSGSGLLQKAPRRSLRDRRMQTLLQSPLFSFALMELLLSLVTPVSPLTNPPRQPHVNEERPMT